MLTAACQLEVLLWLESLPAGGPAVAGSCCNARRHLPAGGPAVAMALPCQLLGDILRASYTRPTQPGACKV